MSDRVVVMHEGRTWRAAARPGHAREGDGAGHGDGRMRNGAAPSRRYGIFVALVARVRGAWPRHRRLPDRRQPDERAPPERVHRDPGRGHELRRSSRAGSISRWAPWWRSPACCAPTCWRRGAAFLRGAAPGWRSAFSWAPERPVVTRWDPAVHRQPGMMLIARGAAYNTPTPARSPACPRASRPQPRPGCPTADHGRRLRLGLAAAHAHAVRPPRLRHGRKPRRRVARGHPRDRVLLASTSCAAPAPGSPASSWPRA